MQFVLSNAVFCENAGELCFIALEREKDPHTSPTSHTGTKYERWILKQNRLSYEKKGKKHDQNLMTKDLANTSQA
jgi:hypothetical protein